MSIPWQKHGVTGYTPDKACQGYTLIAPFTSHYAWLIDMKGNYVHVWKLKSQPRNHAVLLPNGNLLYASAGPLPPPADRSFPQVGSWGKGGGLVELDWESNEVWTYKDKFQSHSFYRMDNGNTIIPRITRVPDTLAVKLKGGTPGSEDRGIIWSDGLHEVTPRGQVVWEWNMVDHLDPDYHILCPLEPRGDFTHMNSCEVISNGRNCDSGTYLYMSKLHYFPSPILQVRRLYPSYLPVGNSYLLVVAMDRPKHKEDFR
ncbi:hypothetical protein ACFLS8_00610 [Chloroflexota bacterium]